MNMASLGVMPSMASMADRYSWVRPGDCELGSSGPFGLQGQYRISCPMMAEQNTTGGATDVRPS
jgi:hypothetical protein